MALLKFISLSVGSLMLLQGSYAEYTPSAAASTTDVCLPLINTARKEVGLSEFTKETEKPHLKPDTPETNETMKAICKALAKGAPEAAELEGKVEGTAAYFVQNSDDCQAAVNKWKEGFSSFKTYTNTVPPPFKKSAGAGVQTGNAPYDTADAVNFVALYSPRDPATAACAFITCKDTSNSEIKATVCITYPDALQDTAEPYTKDQWDNILKVFAPAASSASAAVPTVLALAAAAVGVALM